MRKIRLHARAESDLIDIWQYSFEEWDDVQADKYLDELNAAIDSLAANPYLGVKRSTGNLPRRWSKWVSKQELSTVSKRVPIGAFSTSPMPKLLISSIPVWYRFP